MAGRSKSCPPCGRSKAQGVVRDVPWRVGLAHGVAEGVYVAQRSKFRADCILKAKVVVAADTDDGTGLRVASMQLLDVVRVAHPFPSVPCVARPHSSNSAQSWLESKLRIAGPRAHRWSRRLQLGAAVRPVCKPIQRWTPE